MDSARRTSLVGPAILIVLGLLFLLNSLEVVPWTVWGTLWRFWPMILILIGVEIILSRTGASRLISLTVALAIVVLLMGAVIGAAQTGRIRGITLPPGENVEEAERLEPGSVSEDLGDLQEARVTVDFGAGQLTLGSESATDKLAVVDYTVGSLGRVPRLDLSRTGRQGTLRITGGEDFRLGRRAEPDRWNLRLNPTIPLDLTIRVGAVDGTLGLGGLKVRTLNLDVGASSLSVNFPAGAGSTRAFLSSGAASLNLEIPAGVGARIASESGLASINASSRFSKSGDVYTTSDYQTAANRLDLELRAGVSSVNIK